MTTENKTTPRQKAVIIIEPWQLEVILSIVNKQTLDIFVLLTLSHGRLKFRDAANGMGSIKTNGIKSFSENSNKCTSIATQKEGVQITWKGINSHYRDDYLFNSIFQYVGDEFFENYILTLNKDEVPLGSRDMQYICTTKEVLQQLHNYFKSHPDMVEESLLRIEKAWNDTVEKREEMYNQGEYIVK